MTPNQIHEVLKCVEQLYPALDWTDDLAALFAERAKRLALSTEQATAVVREYRATKRHKSPVLADLLGMLENAARTAKTAAAPTRIHEPAYNPAFPPITGFMRGLWLDHEQSRPVFLKRAGRRIGEGPAAVVWAWFVGRMAAA